MQVICKIRNFILILYISCNFWMNVLLIFKDKKIQWWWSLRSGWGPNPAPLNGGRNLFVIFLLFFLNYSVVFAVNSTIFHLRVWGLPKKWNSTVPITWMRCTTLYYGTNQLRTKNLKNCSFYYRPLPEYTLG